MPFPGKLRNVLDYRIGAWVYVFLVKKVLGACPRRKYVAIVGANKGTYLLEDLGQLVAVCPFLCRKLFARSFEGR